MRADSTTAVGGCRTLDLSSTKKLPPASSYHREERERGERETSPPFSSAPPFSACSFSLFLSLYRLMLGPSTHLLPHSAQETHADKTRRETETPSNTPSQYIHTEYTDTGARRDTEILTCLCMQAYMLTALIHGTAVRVECWRDARVGVLRTYVSQGQT